MAGRWGRFITDKTLLLAESGKRAVRSLESASLYRLGFVRRGRLRYAAVARTALCFSVASDPLTPMLVCLRRKLHQFPVIYGAHIRVHLGLAPDDIGVSARSVIEI